ncbi:MAG TPA: 4'-phosphopantetheinyl transferase superfamily protein [Acidimicrobiales bacterium]|nr:4'-phosphopantetheinyl transferase superfamily protein [Acidimicrobiales bacterium]
MLPGGDAHVWAAQAGQEPRGLHVLSEEERARAAGFRFDEDRRRWVTSRVLLRLVLGRYLDSDPAALVMASAARGRPIVRSPADSDWLSFSYSRSGELCVVAVVRGPAIGIDVERVRTDHDLVAIARRALGDDLAARLEALPDGQRVSEFYRAWVREEAKGKCRGTGLVEPDDAARRLPLFVADLALGEGYAGALASDTCPDIVRVCSAEV